MVKAFCLSIASLAALLAGCAHTMNISPDLDKLVASAESSRVPKNVGLYIWTGNRNQQVTTPGGGGDKVTYRPYADMETGLYKMLGNVYQDVTLLNSLNDPAAIAKNSLIFIIEPRITTTSSSSGWITWMATDFSVNLTCKISDSSLHQIAEVSASGTGHADFSELKRNFSLAGQRASLQALLNEQALLLRNAEQGANP